MKYCTYDIRLKSLLFTNVNLYHIVKVRFTPLLYIVRKCGAEHGSSNVWRIASLVDSSKLERKNYTAFTLLLSALIFNIIVSMNILPN